MNKAFDTLYKFGVWIIVALSIFGYFAYRVLKFDGDIHTVINSWDTWLNLAFVIFLNLTVQSGANDSGISYGIQSEEFELAENINNKIIQKANGNMKTFRQFVKNLNREELGKIRDEFLFKIGDKDVEELTKKELKKYNKLKAIRHDISGFNLALYYTLERGNKMSYSASFNKSKGFIRKKLMKVLNGVLFGAMTVNVVFSASGIGAALISILIIAFGLGLTFVMSFIPPAFKLKYDIPKRVIRKKTLWDSYEQAPDKMKQPQEVINEEEPQEELQVVETKEQVSHLQEIHNLMQA